MSEMSEMKYENEYVRYIFTEEDEKQLAVDMARNVGDLKKAEDDKKSVMSNFKSKIDELQGEINQAARLITAGYEMRDIKCAVVFDYEYKEVLYVRTDTGEVCRVRNMRADEIQMTLDEIEEPEETEVEGEKSA